MGQDVAVPGPGRNWFVLTGAARGVLITGTVPPGVIGPNGRLCVLSGDLGGPISVLSAAEDPPKDPRSPTSDKGKDTVVLSLGRLDAAAFVAALVASGDADLGLLSEPTTHRTTVRYCQL